MNIAAYIDHTVLKATTSNAEVSKICNECKEYNFAAACIPPTYVKDAVQYLKESSSKVATVIGFPFGYHQIATKITEAKQAIADGAYELDMVMNIAAFKNKNFSLLEEEVSLLLAETKKSNRLLKVIIESGILSDEEIIKCCELYRKYDIDFLKTSTGYAEKGASVAAVKLMRSHLPLHIQIKASGGIKTFAFAKELIDAGATRIGCSAGIAIVKGEEGASTGY